MTFETVREKGPVGVGASVALLVLLLISVPHIDRSRLPAQASTAVGTLRNIAVAQKEFRAEHGCYANGLTELPLTSNRSNVYVDYAYALFPEAHDSTGCVTQYLATASPASSGRIGLWYFSVDETETIHFEKTHTAGRTSPLLQ